MCLISFAWRPDSGTPLVMVANRDEFHRRPTLPAHFWTECPSMLAGKDLEAGGSWLGITRNGRFAALTNYRQVPAPYVGQISRGELVTGYLQSHQSAADYLQLIAANATRYDGFNLIVGDLKQCWYFSNRNPQGPQALTPGIYGLSNHLLNTPWPKVQLARENLTRSLQNEPQLEQLHHCLSATDIAPDHALPDTGIGQNWERMLSAARIISPQYGTRANTRLILQEQQFQFQEDTYNPAGDVVNSEQFIVKLG